jgi:hypothetical protein
LIRGGLTAVSAARVALGLGSADSTAPAALTLTIRTLAILTLAETTAAALGLALSHPLLERRAFLGRHRGHALFHPLAPFLGRHVRIEPAAAAAVKTATAALRSALAAAVRGTVRSHSIATTLSFGLRAFALTLTTTLSLALGRSRLRSLWRHRRLLRRF